MCQVSAPTGNTFRLCVFSLYLGPGFCQTLFAHFILTCFSSLRPRPGLSPGSLPSGSPRIPAEWLLLVCLSFKGDEFFFIISSAYVSDTLPCSLPTGSCCSECGYRDQYQCHWGLMPAIESQGNPDLVYWISHAIQFLGD